MIRDLAKVIRGVWVVALTFLALALVFLYLRTTPTPLSTLLDFEALTQGGQPVLVEFYSNF
jgi:hypothetical protein